MAALTPSFVRVSPSYVMPEWILQYQQASGAFELPDGADKVSLVIKSESGLVVDTQDLASPDGSSSWPGGIHSFTWDGITTSGAKATPGNYSFEVKATNGKAAATSNPLSKWKSHA